MTWLWLLAGAVAATVLWKAVATAVAWKNPEFAARYTLLRHLKKRGAQAAADMAVVTAAAETAVAVSSYVRGGRVEVDYGELTSVLELYAAWLDAAQKPGAVIPEAQELVDIWRRKAEDSR